MCVRGQLPHALGVGGGIGGGVPGKKINVGSPGSLFDVRGERGNQCSGNGKRGGARQAFVWNGGVWVCLGLKKNGKSLEGQKMGDRGGGGRTRPERMTPGGDGVKKKEEV